MRGKGRKTMHVCEKCSKPATVQTGATVMVPLFISTGEKIKVDTRDGRYLGRG